MKFCSNRKFLILLAFGFLLALSRQVIADSTPLKNIAAKRGFYVGALLSGTEQAFTPSNPTDPSSLDVWSEDFNMINDSGMKFINLEPVPPKFVNGTLVPNANPFLDFTFHTTVEDYAAAHEMKLHAHTLLYNLAEPLWLTGCTTTGVNPLTCKTPYNPDELQQILKYHIQTVLKYYEFKYPGLFVSWDVANEVAYGTDYGSRHSVFERITDPTNQQSNYTYYLSLAFKYAQEAAPNALLCLNDNTFENVDGARAKRVLEFVQTLKNLNAPIGCMGYEMHKSLAADTSAFSIATQDEMLKSMLRFADIGVKVFLTEMDIGIPVISSQPAIGAAAPANSTENPNFWSAQASAYSDALSACLAARNCDGAIVWDINSGYNWEGGSGGLSLYGLPAGFGGDATILDVNNLPKPAYTAVQKALEQAVSNDVIVGGSGSSSGGLSVTNQGSSPVLQDIHINAFAVSASKGWPIIDIYLNGVKQTSVKVISNQAADYPAQVVLPVGKNNISFSLDSASTEIGASAVVGKVWSTAAAPVFKTILGNQFTLPTSGSFSVDAQNTVTSQIHLSSNDSISQSISIPITGNYEFILSAQGIPYQSVSPEADLIVDGVSLANFSVSATSTARDYMTGRTLTAGMHTIKIALTNASATHRTLSIDHLSLESMPANSTEIKSTGMTLTCSGCVPGERISAAGNFEADLYLSKGSYNLDILAASAETKSSTGAWNYGGAVVTVDGVRPAGGSFYVTSPSWTDYVLPIYPLESGNHKIVITFGNASVVSPGGFFLTRSLLIDGIKVTPK